MRTAEWMQRLRIDSRRFASMLLMSFVVVLLSAASRAEVRVALVIGVGNYKNAPHLANPPNDASDIRDSLKQLGFDTEALIDPDRAGLETAIRNFGRRARTADVALFFYAGHALEYGGRNWLIPATADIGSEKDLRFEAIDLADITDQLDGGPRLSVLFLDSCRDNPFRARLGEASRGLARSGLGEVRVAAGALVAFSTAPGTTAEDGVGRNSPFTGALLANIATPGLEVRQMLDRVRRDVRLATRGRQVPWENSSMEGEFYMIPAAATPPSPLPLPAPVAASPPRPSGEAERVFWESVRNSDDPGDLELYLSRFPNGEFADIAHRFIARIHARQAVRDAPAPPATPIPPREPVAAAPTPIAPAAAPNASETNRGGAAAPTAAPPTVAKPPAPAAPSTASIPPADPRPQPKSPASPPPVTRQTNAKARPSPAPAPRPAADAPERQPSYPPSYAQPYAPSYPPQKQWPQGDARLAYPAPPAAAIPPPQTVAPSYLGTSSGGAGGCSLSHVC